MFILWDASFKYKCSARVQTHPDHTDCIPWVVHANAFSSHQQSKNLHKPHSFRGTGQVHIPRSSTEVGRGSVGFPIAACSPTKVPHTVGPPTLMRGHEQRDRHRVVEQRDGPQVSDVASHMFLSCQTTSKRTSQYRESSSLSLGFEGEEQSPSCAPRQPRACWRVDAGEGQAAETGWRPSQGCTGGWDRRNSGHGGVPTRRASHLKSPDRWAPPCPLHRGVRCPLLSG